MTICDAEFDSWNIVKKVTQKDNKSLDNKKYDRIDYALKKRAS